MRALVSYAGLELKRNRLLYLGWPCVILGSMPFTAFVARLSGVSVHEGCYGITVAWLLIGMPFNAILFGSVAGASMNGRAEEDDAPLAISPAARALGAACAGLAASSVCALLLLAIGAEIGSAILGPSIVSMPSTFYTIEGGVVACLLLTAFAAAHIFCNAVMGGAFATFGSLVLCLGIAAGAHLEATSGMFEVDALGALSVLATSMMGAVLSVAIASALSRKPQRRWRGILLATALPFAASALALSIESFLEFHSRATIPIGARFRDYPLARYVSRVFREL